LGEEAELRDVLRLWFGEKVGIAVAAIRDAPALFAEEEAYVHQAVAKRRREFATGRSCARHALAQLGFPPNPIPMGRLHEPVWPAGATGSITHSGDVCAAVALHSSDYAGVGIDLLESAEAAAILAEAGSRITSADEEREARAALPAGIVTRPLLFSAKESAIKALSASAGRLIGFAEVQVTFSGSCFHATLGVGESAVSGWWQSAGRFLVTGARLPAVRQSA
jgi:4'-phosphopantetheinyl transferase EntD